ncbi:MAG: C39 family peptidase [Candidatus Spechtbacterales bacterium]|nr:C39 family peptidase [Candidatus Spechtbacterales bacterium]
MSFNDRKNKKIRYIIYYLAWGVILVFVVSQAYGALFSNDESVELNDTQNYKKYTPQEENDIPSTDTGTEDRIEEDDDYFRDHTKQVVYNVPFTAQAPLGDWSDPRQQDGCEEAAALMAVSWARGEDFTLAEARDEIIKIAEYTKNKYGAYRDTSARDAFNWIYKDYFGYTNVRLNYNITTEDIKRELYAGNLVVVPANGRILDNPHFTPPGPERHMFVITGFDPKTGEFITNDNGTRYGEDFRYTEANISAALQDYPTGYHEPILNKITSMIVISK